MPRAPCLLCAASTPLHLPTSDDIEGENKASVRRRSRARTPDRAGAHPGRRSAMALRLLSLKASDSVGRLLGHTADDPISIAVANRRDDSITNFIQTRL